MCSDKDVRPHRAFVSSEAGFTIIEVLVSSAIVVILAGLSLQAHRVYTERTYHSVSEQTLRFAVQALDAGKAQEEQFSANFLSIWQDASGPAATAQGQELLPGFIFPEDSQVFVQHNAACLTEFCLEDYVQVRHCRSGAYTYWWRLHNGFQNLEQHVNAGWDC